MSAMLGSSRREVQARVNVDSHKIVLVERPAGTVKFWTARLVARLETLFGPAKLRR
jgi:hypothetical protein